MDEVEERFGWLERLRYRHELAAVIVAGLVAAAVHGFGAEGFEGHGPDAIEHGHGI
ncbi:hypothetical protein AB0F15_18350 [Amycolatopsis sp. NPDC026612]|uniref:hypothetical protein n=1 Tax=Amycolatopsis sp. NPDC026612 TaxID=3155466 RepID=UPI0033D70D48